jgi:hypothetical protein
MYTCLTCMSIGYSVRKVIVHNVLGSGKQTTGRISLKVGFYWPVNRDQTGFSGFGIISSEIKKILQRSNKILGVWKNLHILFLDISQRNLAYL